MTVLISFNIGCPFVSSFNCNGCMVRTPRLHLATVDIVFDILFFLGVGK